MPGVANFKDLLTKPIEETERPKPIPPGTYIVTTKDHAFDVSSKKQTPYVQFNYIVSEPQDDVDEDLLEVFGGTEKLMVKALNTKFYLTGDAMFMLKEYLEEALEISTGGRNYDEVLPETTGMRCLVHITHAMAQDGKTPYAQIESFAPLSALETDD